MNARQTEKSFQGIEQDLETICMSARMSDEALHDARLAGKIVDGIAWICSKVAPDAGVFAKPSPRY